MRIAVVVSTFPPYQGGMGNMARAYALGLSRHGHEVEVFCPAGRKREEELPGPYRVQRLKAWARFRNSAFLPQLFNRLEGFDVVNLHYPFYGGVESILLKKWIRKEKLPLVVNFQMDNFGKGLMGLAQSAYQKFLLPSVLKAAERVIVTSLDYAEHSSAAGALRRFPEKFTALPPGVDTDRFTPAAGRNRLAKYGIPDTEGVVLFVGGLDRAHAFKGVGFLLKTWAEMKPLKAKLLIVGRGELRSAYLRQAADLGLASDVVFDDTVADDDLPSVYRSADLVVLPSLDRSEAFGIVLIEALASGVPVVASNLPGVRSIIENGRNGFTFETGDSARPRGQDHAYA